MLKRVLALVISVIMAASLLTACIGGGSGDGSRSDKGSSSSTSEGAIVSTEIPSDASSAANDKSTNGENAGTGGEKTGAKGAVTIDISTLGGADADNKAATAESQWQYVDNKKDEPQNSKVLYLTSPEGNYTLKGTNRALRMQVATGATGAKVTLSSIIVAAPPQASAFGIAANCTVSLTGNNVLTADHIMCMNVSESKNCTIIGDGFLELISHNYYALVLRKDASLSIEESARFEAKNTYRDLRYAATWCEGNNKIKVGKKCSFISRGCGSAILSKGDLSLTCDGAVTVSSYYYQGMWMTPAEKKGDTLTIDGSGMLDVYGSAGYVAIDSEGIIKMGDGLTVKLHNKAAANPEIHTFVALNANSGYRWKVTDAARVSGSLTDASIDVVIDPDKTCVMQRVRK